MLLWKYYPSINYVISRLSTWLVGELRHLYRITPIAVIGGSFLPGFTGHNISEAAAAGCAVLTGKHNTPYIFSLIA